MPDEPEFMDEVVTGEMLARANEAVIKIRDIIGGLIDKLNAEKFTDAHIAAVVMSLGANVAGNILGFVAESSSDPKRYVDEACRDLPNVVRRYAADMMEQIKEHKGAGHA